MQAAALVSGVYTLQKLQCSVKYYGTPINQLPWNPELCTGYVLRSAVLLSNPKLEAQSLNLLQFAERSFPKLESADFIAKFSSLSSRHLGFGVLEFRACRAEGSGPRLGVTITVSIVGLFGFNPTSYLGSYKVTQIRNYNGDYGEHRGCSLGE